MIVWCPIIIARAGADGGLHNISTGNTTNIAQWQYMIEFIREGEPQTSSKKIIQGAHVLARLNIVRTSRSLAPTYLFKSSGP